MKKLALLVAGVAALVFAGVALAAGSDYFTMTVNPNEVTYGESVTSISGSLLHNGTNDAVGSATVNVSAGASDCTGLSLLDSTTTASDGSWSIAGFTPDAAGAWGAYAVAPGPGGSTLASTCGSLTVDQAPTDTSITNAPVTTLALGLSLSVDYKVESAFGISGNTTDGTASIDETDVLGTLGCGAGDTLSAAQSNADGSGAADAGFSATGTLSCTPTAVGTYTYNAAYTGDSNYVGSNSSPDQTLDVSDQTVQVCMAAPAIVAQAMMTAGIKQGSKTWKAVITWVAGNTGSNGKFFAQNVCADDYRSNVISETNDYGTSTPVPGYKTLS